MRIPKVDRSWTLFLDRDGVLNRQRVDDYVKSVHEFEWLPDVLEALIVLRQRFGRLIVVTNQQGVGKGHMSFEDLDSVHAHLRGGAAQIGVDFDGIYFCTSLASAGDPCRKPGPGMGLAAQRDFPEIDFKRAILVGDSVSDLGFGESLGMYTVGIGARVAGQGDASFGSLAEFAAALSEVPSTP